MKEIPRIQIAHLPTPVEYLPRLTETLGGPKIFIKRDDQTGLAFGGNKTRKLELLAADAKAKGARTLITAGAIQSNHCRQTAAAAAKLGFDCVLVLTVTDQEKGTLRTENVSGNLFLDTLFGAQVTWSSRRYREKDIDKTFAKLEEEDRKPYIIPYGGSNSIGAAAYALAMKEFLAQIKTGGELGEQPDWIVFPTSSGGTQAGLILGKKIFGYQGNILGISVDEPAEILKKRVSDLVKSTAEYLDEELHISADEILVNDEFLGEGYGIPGELEIEAIRLFSRWEGMLLDPVYTARAAGGLTCLIRDGFFKTPGKSENSLLFWHTGGTPALFVDKYRELLNADISG